MAVRVDRIERVPGRVFVGKPDGHRGGVVVVADVDHPVVVFPPKVRLELGVAVRAGSLFVGLGVHEVTSLLLGQCDWRRERSVGSVELLRQSFPPVLLVVLAVLIEGPGQGVEEVAHVHLVLLPRRSVRGEIGPLVELDGDELRESAGGVEDVPVDVRLPSAKVVEREATLEGVRYEVAVQLPNVFTACAGSMTGQRWIRWMWGDGRGGKVGWIGHSRAVQKRGWERGLGLPLLGFVLVVGELDACFEHDGELRGIHRPVWISV